LLKEIEIKELLTKINNAEKFDDIKNILINNFNDIIILKNTGLGDRLLEDIIEAFIEFYNIDKKILRNT
jgi:hypothetical protein